MIPDPAIEDPSTEQRLEADHRHHQRWYWSSAVALALITLAVFLLIDLPAGRASLFDYTLSFLALFFLLQNALMASWLRHLRGPITRPVAPALTHLIQRARVTWCIAYVLVGSARHAAHLPLPAAAPHVSVICTLAAAGVVALIGVAPLARYWLRQETAEGVRCRNCGQRLHAGPESTCSECGWRGAREG